MYRTILSLLTASCIASSFIPVAGRSKDGSPRAWAKDETVREIKAPGDELVSGLAWDGEQLWSQETSDDGRVAALHKIRSTDGVVLRSCPAPGRASRGLTWGEGILWAGDTSTNCIYGIDAAGCGVVREFCEPLDVSGVTWESSTAGGPHLWYSDGDQDVIVKMKIETGEVVLTMPAPASGPGDLAWDDSPAGGPYLWIVDFDTERIYRVRVEDWSVTLTLPAPGHGQAHGLAWDGKSLWSSDMATGRIYQIDGAFDQIDEP